jgi:aconitase B
MNYNTSKGKIHREVDGIGPILSVFKNDEDDIFLKECSNLQLRKKSKECHGLSNDPIDKNFLESTSSIDCVFLCSCDTNMGSTKKQNKLVQR